MARAPGRKWGDCVSLLCCPSRGAPYSYSIKDVPKQILLAGPVKNSPDQAPHQVSCSRAPSPDQGPLASFIIVGPLAGPEAPASLLCCPSRGAPYSYSIKDVPKQILLAGPVKNSPDQAPHQVSCSRAPSPDQGPLASFIIVGPLAGPEAPASFIIAALPS